MRDQKTKLIFSSILNSQNFPEASRSGQVRALTTVNLKPREKSKGGITSSCCCVPNFVVLEETNETRVSLLTQLRTIVELSVVTYDFSSGRQAEWGSWLQTCILDLWVTAQMFQSKRAFIITLDKRRVDIFYGKQ